MASAKDGDFESVKFRIRKTIVGGNGNSINKC